jgi:hypothetical protein
MSLQGSLTRLKLKNAGNGGTFSDFGLPQMEIKWKRRTGVKEELRERLQREFAEKFEAARGPESPKITEEERRRRVEQRANLLMQAALKLIK